MPALFVVVFSFLFFKLDSQTCSGVLVRRVFALKGISKSRPQRSRSVLIKEHQISTASFSFSPPPPPPSALLCSANLTDFSILLFISHVRSLPKLLWAAQGFRSGLPTKLPLSHWQTSCLLSLQGLHLMHTPE